MKSPGRKRRVPAHWLDWCIEDAASHRILSRNQPHMMQATRLAVALARKPGARFDSITDSMLSQACDPCMQESTTVELGLKPDSRQIKQWAANKSWSVALWYFYGRQPTDRKPRKPARLRPENARQVAQILDVSPQWLMNGTYPPAWIKAAAEALRKARQELLDERENSADLNGYWFNFDKPAEPKYVAGGAFAKMKECPKTLTLLNMQTPRTCDVL
jgi:hypothetical protein